MAITEEINVLKTMALDPIQLLVSPKFLALLVVMPCLTVVADLAGILAGGWFVYSTVGTSLCVYPYGARFAVRSGYCLVACSKALSSQR